MPRRLDYRPREETFAWLDEREEWLFSTYLDHGSVRKLMVALQEQSLEGGWPLCRETVYQWLRLTDERALRWEEVLQLRAYLSESEAQEIAEAATQKDANASRLKYEAKMKAAEWQNRSVFGKRPEVQVALGVGGEWAAALQAVLSTSTGQITVGSQPKALPKPEEPEDG